MDRRRLGDNHRPLGHDCPIFPQKAVEAKPDSTPLQALDLFGALSDACLTSPRREEKGALELKCDSVCRAARLITWLLQLEPLSC